MSDPAKPKYTGKDPDVNKGNTIGYFMLLLRKIQHTIEDEPHYNLVLTWPEIQALIDVTDAYSSLGGEVDFNKLCGKMSEQLKWQASGPK